MKYRPDPKDVNPYDSKACKRIKLPIKKHFRVKAKIKSIFKFIPKTFIE